MNSARIMIVAAIAVPTFSAKARAEVCVANTFSHHMVLQRARPVHVRGSAKAGKIGQVEFRGHLVSFAADNLGRWTGYLPSGVAGRPFELRVLGSTLVQLSDIPAGDVWVASDPRCNLYNHVGLPAPPFIWR
jgi:sialate O-acetylesterase